MAKKAKAALENFVERNAAWPGTKREFHQVQSRTGTPRVWRIWLSNNSVFTTWGQLGGKMVTPAEEKFDGINLGQTNYKTPEQYALERAREMCRKKVWEGYREVGLTGDGEFIGFLDPLVETTIDFNHLPLSLSFYKPDNSMGAGITRKAEDGRVWYTRKRNGMMKVLVKGSDGELRIYSRKMLRQHDDETETEYTWDDRFPHLIHAIEKHIPDNTILLGELVVEDIDGRERFDLAQSYIKSLTPKAVSDMSTSGLYPFFYCWDIGFWDGRDVVSTEPVRFRFDGIRALEKAIDSEHFEGVTIMDDFASTEEANRFALKHGWEGFVVVDPDGVYGDKAYNYKGKPDRPGTVCAKLKPAFEDDFIALWDPENGYGERSRKGSRDGGIKSVGLYQHNPQGKLVFIANVSSGLTKKMLATLPGERWPQVWKIGYTGRRYISDGDDTNALDFPRFLEVRGDKTAVECVNERLT